MKSFEEKRDFLLSFLKGYSDQPVMVAFSGGVDSSLLLKLMCDLSSRNHQKVYAVTLHTQLHPMKDLEIARSVSREVGAFHCVLPVNEIEEAGILNNPPDRCYLCKKYLFSKIRQEAEKMGVEVIFDGTHEEDFHSYRPGLKALEELKIISPLALAGMKKEEIRKMAEEAGISVQQRPSAPCLATRFPYHTPLSYEKMKMADQGESYLRSLGFYNVRLRFHGEVIRIEVDAQDIALAVVHREGILKFLKKMGFTYITLDMEGFRSGSMDTSLIRQEV